MKKIEIEAAAERDVAVVLQMVRALAAYEKLSDRVVATEAGLREALFGDRPVGEAVIAYADGAPVGIAIFYPTFSTFLGRPGLYLEDLFVEPESRRLGIGRRLLAHVARLVSERGYHGLKWSVLGWNESAMQFYRSLGAEPVDEWRVFRLDGDALVRLGRSG